MGESVKLISASTYLPVSIVGVAVVVASFAVRTYYIAEHNRTAAIYDRQHYQAEIDKLRDEVREVDVKVNSITSAFSSIDSTLKHILIAIEDLKKEQIRLRVEKERERLEERRSPRD